MNFLDLVVAELAKAEAKHASIHSAHEAIAVIREEYLEAEREVFAQQCDRPAFLKELVQLAAMCARTAKDLKLLEPPRIIARKPCDSCGEPLDNLLSQYVMSGHGRTREVCHKCKPVLEADGYAVVAQAKEI